MNIEDILIYNALSKKYAVTSNAKNWEITLENIPIPAAKETYIGSFTALLGGNINVFAYYEDKSTKNNKHSMIIYVKENGINHSMGGGDDGLTGSRNVAVKPFHTYDVYLFTNIQTVATLLGVRAAIEELNGSEPPLFIDNTKA